MHEGRYAESLRAIDTAIYSGKVHYLAHHAAEGRAPRKRLAPAP
ncbi:hypothetical protein AHiyo1_23510 [Arthrobacter sp. Hiyo1]|nr:hypothetical protein AHiyo1_23510 [Arthrobacter sp. Hiyo1]